MITIRSKCWVIVLLLVCNASVCSAKFKRESSAYPLHYLNRQLTKILINDNFSPPLASRVYAYTSIAAYTVLAGASGMENKLGTSIAGLPKFAGPGKPAPGYSPSVASAYAFYYLSKKLIYTFQPFDDSFKVLLKWYRREGCTQEEIDGAQKAAKEYADDFIKWTSKDLFTETRKMSEYVLDEKPGNWIPTYPGYMSALEPNWGLLRLLIADSDKVELNTFAPLPFDTAVNSPLYKEALGIFNKWKYVTTEELATADFWDCNAFAMFPEGHRENIVKKMSPGGHWMSITTIAATTANADLLKSAFAYAATSAALFDGFIFTWKLKYKFRTARPETIMQSPETYLANLGYPDFRPYLQSPPFPEYISGHAVVSMSAAIVLTHIFGADFHFTDNTEDRWGIPARSFSSFTNAATEAANSRFYGLIHFKYACDDGQKLGALIGKSVVARIKE